jgi:hypothetical protein
MAISRDNDGLNGLAKSVLIPGTMQSVSFGISLGQYVCIHAIFAL